MLLYPVIQLQVNDFIRVLRSVTVEQLHESPGQKNKQSEVALSYNPYLHSALDLRIQFELESHDWALLVQESGHAP